MYLIATYSNPPHQSDQRDQDLTQGDHPTTLVERKRFEPTVEDSPEEDSRLLGPTVPITPYQSTHQQSYQHHQTSHGRAPSGTSAFHPPHPSFGRGQSYSDNKPFPVNPFPELNVPPRGQREYANLHQDGPPCVEPWSLHRKWTPLCCYPQDDEGYYLYSLMPSAEVQRRF